MNCNKCEFCANGVAAACVTCDAPMCSFHAKRWRHGECKDCWTERWACQDCGAPNHTGTPLCYECSTKPGQQTDLCALPACNVCNRYEVHTEVCRMCAAVVCGSCMWSCADCKMRYCTICTNRDSALRTCGHCFTKDMVESDEEERFWRLSIRPPALLCSGCLHTHKLWAHDTWGGMFSDTDYSPPDGSASEGELDNAQAHYLPPAYEDDDDTASQCSTAA